MLFNLGGTIHKQESSADFGVYYVLHNVILSFDDAKNDNDIVMTLSLYRPRSETVLRVVRV